MGESKVEDPDPDVVPTVSDLDLRPAGSSLASLSANKSPSAEIMYSIDAAIGRSWSAILL